MFRNDAHRRHVFEEAYRIAAKEKIREALEESIRISYRAVVPHKLSSAWRARLSRALRAGKMARIL